MKDMTYGQTDKSHDIRTPLNVILGFTEILKETKEINSEFFMTLAMIDRNAKYLASLLDEILGNAPQETSALDILQHEAAITTELKSCAPCLLRGYNVLLVDDVQENQILFSKVLRTAGAKVSVVENGQEALERARSNGYDLILMDMEMPVMDGFDATKTLRLEGNHTLIIALTARCMASDRDRCLASGCDDFVTKPVQPRQLIEKINSWLQ